MAAILFLVHAALKYSKPVLFGGASAKYGSLSIASRRSSETLPDLAHSPSLIQWQRFALTNPAVEKRIPRSRVEANNRAGCRQHGDVGDATNVQDGPVLSCRPQTTIDEMRAREALPRRHRARSRRRKSAMVVRPVPAAMIFGSPICRVNGRAARGWCRSVCP